MAKRAFAWNFFRTISLALIVALLLSASFSEAATLTGTVVDTIGQPLADTLIGLYQTPTSQSAASLTDALGHYEISNIPGGEYRVQIIQRNHGYSVLWYPDRTSYETAEIITFADGDEKALNMTLATDSKLNVRVINQGNQPLPGIFINIYDTSFHFIAGAQSDIDGNSLIEGIPPGAYVALFADSAQRIPFLWYGGTKDYRQAAHLTIPTGSGTTELAMVLKPKGLPPFLLLLDGN